MGYLRREQRRRLTGASVSRQRFVTPAGTRPDWCLGNLLIWRRTKQLLSALSPRSNPTGPERQPSRLDWTPNATTAPGLATPRRGWTGSSLKALASAGGHRGRHRCGGRQLHDGVRRSGGHRHTDRRSSPVIIRGDHRGRTSGSVQPRQIVRPGAHFGGYLMATHRAA